MLCYLFSERHLNLTRARTCSQDLIKAFDNFLFCMKKTPLNFNRNLKVKYITKLFKKKYFVKIMQKRNDVIFAARKLSSAMSTAKAICDHLRSWFHGTSEDDWVSMGVISDGTCYGIEADLVCSFPVHIDKNKNWKIVQGLDINEWERGLIEAIAKTLIEERNELLQFEQSENMEMGIDIPTMEMDLQTLNINQFYINIQTKNMFLLDESKKAVFAG